MGDDELAAIYLKTLVHIEEDGRMVPARDAQVVQRSTVHVITAWNPGHERPTPEQNDAASQQLFDLLTARGGTPIPALGQDPNSPHCEQSWAVTGLSDDEARMIGASFGQVAVFRLEPGLQTVLGCSEPWRVSRPL